MLALNTFFEAVGSIAMGLLVWLWTRRAARAETARAVLYDQPSQAWGDPRLLLPVAALLIAWLLSFVVRFDSTAPINPTSLIDVHFFSPSFWIFLTLDFAAIVALARLLPGEFRALACGLVAASLFWLNAPMLMVSHAWPQWDSWLPVFFILAVLLVSTNAWLTAGLVLAVGAMLKGQLLFFAPMLVLLPLLAGWPGRFWRISAGLAAGMMLLVWPFLIPDRPAALAVALVLLAGILACLMSNHREIIRQHLREKGSGKYIRATGLILLLALMAFAVLWQAGHGCSREMRIALVMLALITLGVPWLIRNSLIPAYLATILAGSIFITALRRGGDFAWWRVGFIYGTEKHPGMQLGRGALSTIPSLLAERFGWSLHDPLFTLNLPYLHQPLSLDTQQTLFTIFLATLLLCTISAARHLRRGNPRFLMAIVAPWILFLTLLTQLAARYSFEPAVVAAVLIGVGCGVSMLQLLLTILALVMEGNQMIRFYPPIAPGTLPVLTQTYPGLGWGLALLAMIFLWLAIAPARDDSLQAAIDRLKELEDDDE